ncbi:glycosyltransferase family 39 protein [Mucor ambiguus]|uniref:Dolichyl-phosphate-mannose--protein mannosyltransferase n=1 Tax=Mucor ambiguus TaxID=91626 RepID=A0A0C9MR29_9FUNG|nr:glycosyltransferase family 39 protein [Mucor ambiguus]
MSISSSELRQRKAKAAFPMVDRQADDLKKQKQFSKPAAAEASSSNDALIAFSLFIVSLPIRFKSLSHPDQVVFDEVHFGQQASYYITQNFYFDVHPPVSLVKLLIALVGWIAGYNGQFDFKEIGSEYPSSVPYTTIRAVGTLLGCLVVPLAYLTIRNAGHSRIAGATTALAICFENGLITSNRLILLDSYLVFFTAFSIYAYTTFYKQRAFSRSWWIWLLLTGIGAGCTFSSKWVGVFTMITVGVSALKHLWEILGDVRVTKRQYFVHFTARLTCLCIIPVAIYVATFYAHFAILTKSGPGDTYMEIETQNELKGYDPVDTPVPITYGSLITMRHRETTGGYLHSHAANYADGSGQQQITLYPYRDENNWWRILKADVYEKDTHDLLGSDNATYLEYVRNGDIIRLEHVATAPRKLHSHNVPAPVTDTEYHFEVSGYGFVNHTGDSNDFWRVQIDNNTAHPGAGQHLEARRSLFRLEHPNQDCHLYSTYERLPDWGFEQQEVSCIQEGIKSKIMWVIDETENPLLPADVDIEPEHRPGFVSKFIRLHYAMWNFNVGSVEAHPFQTRPYAWPVLRSGINYWVSEAAQIILLGNPLVYWASTVAVFTFGIIYAFFQLRDKRGFHDHFNGKRAFFENSAGFFALGWALHYIPFYYMDRQLFLQHYMPALYLAVLTLGVGVDLMFKRSPCVVKLAFAAVASVCIVYTYYVYSPITYGEPWSVAECEQATLLKSWDLNCAHYDTDAPQRVSLNKLNEPNVVDIEQPMQQEVRLEPEGGIVYVDDQGNRIALEDVPEEYLVHDDDEEDDEDEDVELGDVKQNTDKYDDDDDEEEEEDGPTEAPVFADPEPEFIDGKEVYGDDEDEDEYPKTIYGVDPEADEDEEPDPFPLKVREIPNTIHV